MEDILQDKGLTIDAIKEKCKKGGRYVGIIKKDGEKMAAHFSLLEDKMLVLDGEGNEHFLSQDEIDMMESIQFLS